MQQWQILTQLQCQNVTKTIVNNSMTEDIMMTLENGTSVNKREYFLENYYNAIKNFKEN